MMPGPIITRSSGEPVNRLVDKSPVMAPHGFYRCLGDDAWVAIAVEDDERWSMFLTLLGEGADALAELDRFEAAQSPRAGHRPGDIGLDGQVLAVGSHDRVSSHWRGCLSAHELGARLAWDAHLHERDFFQWVTHPIAGPGPIPGVVFRLGDAGAAVRGPAPLMGQHNEEVLTGLLELDQERLDHMIADGAIA